MTSPEICAEKALVQLERLNDRVEALNATMSEMAKDTKRIAVIEERHLATAAAVERAFVEIGKIQTSAAEQAERNEVAHHGYDKWIWISTGAMLTISVVWTIFGVYLADAVKDTVKGVAEMRMHIVMDKVVAPDDVRSIHRTEAK